MTPVPSLIDAGKGVSMEINEMKNDPRLTQLGS
jgi:hypothetical protein